MSVFYIFADIIEAELIVNILKKKIATVKFSLNVLIDNSGRDKGDDSILIDIIVFYSQFLCIIPGPGNNFISGHVFFRAEIFDLTKLLMNFSCTGTIIINISDNIDEFMVFGFRNINTHIITSTVYKYYNIKYDKIRYKTIKS